MLVDNDIYKITRTDKVDFLQFKKLLEYPELTHCFTLKRHDVGFFPKRKDYLPDHEAYKFIKRYFNIIDETLIRPVQEHTDNLIIYTETYDQENLLLPADGVVTDDKYVCVATIEADCIPMIFYDPVKKVVANVHSGWKGTVQQIGVKAVKSMVENYGCNPEDIICCMAPSIGKDHFLVHDDVKQIYEETFGDLLKKNKLIEDNNISDEKGKQYNIDNPGIYKVLLKEAGLKTENIIDAGLCTICNNEEFHSARFEGPEFKEGMLITMIKNDVK